MYLRSYCIIFGFLNTVFENVSAKMAHEKSGCISNMKMAEEVAKDDDHEIHHLLPVAVCENQDGVILRNPIGKSIVRICFRTLKSECQKGSVM